MDRSERSIFAVFLESQVRDNSHGIAYPARFDAIAASETVGLVDKPRLSMDGKETDSTSTYLTEAVIEAIPL